MLLFGKAMEENALAVTESFLQVSKFAEDCEKTYRL